MTWQASIVRKYEPAFQPSVRTPKSELRLVFFWSCWARHHICTGQSGEYVPLLDHADFNHSSKYKPAAPQAASVPRDDEWHYQFSTQFESCDARRAFPCFDEPNLKATFDFKIEIPEDQIALSNMPQKGLQRSNKAGFHVVCFDKTPVMSTYLLAWAFGDFEHIETFTERKYNGKALPIRLYTTRGLVEQGQFALEHAPKIIDYFSEIFGIDYPLPKSDILAVHEFVRLSLFILQNH